jgi:hypothetical protein
LDSAWDRIESIKVVETVVFGGESAKVLEDFRVEVEELEVKRSASLKSRCSEIVEGINVELNQMKCTNEMDGMNGIGDNVLSNISNNSTAIVTKSF